MEVGMPDQNTKVYRKPGGDEMVVDNGGKLTLGNAAISIDASGRAIVTGLPAADPKVVGALWANAGVLTVSAG
jgi:hypothetical protein